ncbi:MAG: CPBP family intramembrane metalloprotease [Paludibacteraceae bacterium]|nr:CPBP family intramembrane metalloprotease [Paludibacteraceae bacterium]
MKKLLVSIVIAAVLWFVMFSPWTAPMLNFWKVMSVSATLLIALSVWFGKDFNKQFQIASKDIALGLASAVVLWFVFYLGDYFSSLLFDFAKPQVGSIYQMKEGENPLFLGLLLAFLVGPAEEIFWRGYVQRTMSTKYGDWTALIVTTLVYALVHIWSFNFMLIMAALVCGAFWGLLYKYTKNIVTLIISHAVWDVLVFILFPIL